MRIRWYLIGLGCAILAASLYSWADTWRATDNGYAWVDLNSSNAPATEAGEIWQVSASCARPFFVKAALKSKAKLRAYYELAPKEVRALRDREVQRGKLAGPADQRPLYRLASDEQDDQLSDIAQEYDATLHVKYAEWYATASKLVIQLSQWEQRLLNVADQSMMLTETMRKSFRAYSGSDVAGISAKGDFEHYVLFLFGLGGFPSDEEQAIKLNCISIIPVKRIVTGASAFAELWRWPIDYVATFTLGLEFIFAGLFCAPIVRWINSGAPQIGKLNVWRVTSRIVTAVRSSTMETLVRVLRDADRILENTRLGNLLKHHADALRRRTAVLGDKLRELLRSAASNFIATLPS